MTGVDSHSVVSAYPLLLLHAQVAVSFVPQPPPEQAAASFGSKKEQRRQAALREARELGDAMERLLA